MATSTKPRFDFYQTDTAVSVSIYIKGVKEEDVTLNVGESSLSIKAKSQASGTESALLIDPLSSKVNKETSTYKVFSTKIDVVLEKAQAGVHWPKLEGNADSVTSGTTPAYAPVASGSSVPKGTAQKTAAPRARSKWDSLKLEEEEDKAEENSDVNKFFQRLYSDADDETKRAMLKSYQESGGTTLSTDWSKVGKGKVETRPPEGMEARAWEQ